jgi:hypothetical protein
VTYRLPEGGPALGRVHRRLASNGPAVGVALGWQTIADGSESLDGSFVSSGGTRLDVRLFFGATVVGGGAARVVIDGGSFSSTSVVSDPATLSVGTARISLSGWIAIPRTASPVTYTVTAQAQGVGLLASFAPLAGSNLIAEESAT